MCLFFGKNSLVNILKINETRSELEDSEKIEMTIEKEESNGEEAILVVFESKVENNKIIKVEQPESNSVITAKQQKIALDYGIEDIENISNKFRVTTEDGVTEEKILEYTLKYNINGGNGSNFESTEIKGIPCKVTSNTYTKSGYFFNGWSTDPNATTKMYDKNSYITGVYDDEITLYAVWSRKIYDIYNETDLIGFRESINDYNQTYSGETVTLHNDINVSSSWVPIGYRTDQGWSGPHFSGIFEGNNHTITYSLVYTGSNNTGITYGVGFFGSVVSGKVRNLTTSGTLTVTNFPNVAGIVGAALYTEISNCSNKVNVSAYDSVGGITGYSESTTITNCYNEGSISTVDCSAGGITGSTSNTTIIKCYNKGTIKATVYNAGGIGGGIFFGGASISECYNTGTITGQANSGGIVGTNDRGNLTITNCYNRGVITGTTGLAGGILGKTDSWYGEASSSTISNCYNIGYCTGGRYIGGIFGSLAHQHTSDGCTPTVTITNCYWSTKDESNRNLPTNVYGYRYNASYLTLTDNVRLDLSAFTSNTGYNGNGLYYALNGNYPFGKWAQNYSTTNNGYPYLSSNLPR